MTRVLLLNGSPHHAGKTMRLASLVLDAIPADKTVVHLYDKSILPCRDCGACARGTGCPLEDDVASILREVRSADAVAAASPLHFTSLSAPTVALFSRFQQAWRGREGRKGAIESGSERARRAGGLVLTAGSEYPHMFRPATSVAAAAFSTIGSPLAGTAAASNTDREGWLESGDAAAQALALAKAITERICPPPPDPTPR